MSSAPELIIIKNLTTAQNWFVYSTVTNLGNSDIDYGYLSLNYAFNHFGNSGISNPTSTVFNVGTSNFDNGNGDDYIAYCFTSITGYQKIGTYTSQYPSTTSINVGFEPRFVMIKSYNQARNWVMHDSARGADEQLYANLNNAESNTGTQLQFTSTGFDVSGGSNDLDGGSSYSYIYLAIA